MSTEPGAEVRALLILSHHANRSPRLRGRHRVRSLKSRFIYCHAAPKPDPAADVGWSFPDTKEGIRAALAAGATSLWASTTLHSTHPLIKPQDEPASRDVSFVGQDPRDVERFEDKAFCNDWLKKQPGLQDCFPKA